MYLTKKNSERPAIKKNQNVAETALWKGCDQTWDYKHEIQTSGENKDLKQG